jgi:hypothetical protein
MCRADVAPEAAGVLEWVLAEICAALAAEAGIDPSGVIIGPVDFGDDDAMVGDGT